MKLKYLILVSLIIWAEPTLAQDEAPNAEQEHRDDYIVIADPIRDGYITVLASGAREPIDWTGKSVKVFERKDLENVQGGDLTRLLERAPGVTVSRNGSPGNFTAVRVRGAEGEQLLVLIDGVRVADTASPGGGFDFGNLLMSNLAKVELQRSSNSTIWGSQALGGVLAATTGVGPFYQGYWGSAEYGAHDTFYGNAGLSLRMGAADVSLQGGHYTSDGFSAAASGPEPDGFRQTEVSGRVRVALTTPLAAFATGRFADGRAETDGFPAPNFVLADTAEFQDTRQLSGAAGLEWFDENLELHATYSLADTERENFDPAFGVAPGFTADGESERAELRGRWSIDRDFALDFGGEREWQRFSTLFDPLHRTSIWGGYAQLDYDRDALHLAAGLRHDEHHDFGGEWSLGADAAVDFSDQWKLTASYGEGFKAPTLFQLHSDFGNTLLQPERSRSYDFGVHFNNYVDLKLTAFRRDTDGLIGFVSCFGLTTGICTNRPFGTYDNVGRARAQGFEAEGDLQVGYTLVLAAAYTFLDSEDRTPGSATRGNELPRRPRHALTLTGDWKVTNAVNFGADLRVVSHSFDDAANLVRLGGYAVLTLRGEWDVSEQFTLYGRIENLWDEDYQTAAGYGTPGRGAYVGARVRL